jgi:hypothetical protein
MSSNQFWGVGVIFGTKATAISVRTENELIDGKKPPEGITRLEFAVNLVRHSVSKAREGAH